MKNTTSENSRLVVIPTLNEALTIIPLLERLHAPELSPLGLDVLVVDDRSPDGTADLVRDYARSHPGVFVLERDPSGGFAGAYKAGFRWALERGYMFVVQMDADGSHQPEFLPEMFAQAGRADLVVGSRWTRGGRVVNWPLRRLLLSRAGNTYIRMMLRTGVRDATGGFRVWSRRALQSVQIGTLTSEGYAFQIETLRRAEREELTVVEVPIVFPERTYGESKMSSTIVKEALLQVTRWGVEDRRQRLKR